MAKSKVTIKQPDFSNIKQAIQDTILKTGLKIEQYAKESAPVNTGNYRSEISYDGGNEVIASANYSAAIEYGAPPHEIRPNEQTALRFTKNGKEIFAKKVNHPGTRPNPVMRNAAAKVQKEIPQIWAEAQRVNNV